MPPKGLAVMWRILLVIAIWHSLTLYAGDQPVVQEPGTEPGAEQQKESADKVPGEVDRRQPPMLRPYARGEVAQPVAGDVPPDQKTRPTDERAQKESIRTATDGVEQQVRLADSSDELVTVSWWEFGLNAAGLVIGIAGLIALFRTLHETRRAGDAAMFAARATEAMLLDQRDIGRKQVRAYLSIDEASAWFRRDELESLWIEVGCSNAGSSVARFAQIVFDLTIVPVKGEKRFTLGPMPIYLGDISPHDRATDMVGFPRRLHIEEVIAADIRHLIMKAAVFATDVFDVEVVAVAEYVFTKPEDFGVQKRFKSERRTMTGVTSNDIARFRDACDVRRERLEQEDIIEQDT